jgi:hypothetical protein
MQLTAKFDLITSIHTRNLISRTTISMFPHVWIALVLFFASTSRGEVGILLQETVQPMSCQSFTCQNVCLKWFIAVNSSPDVVLGTQKYQHIPSCDCPNFINISQSSLQGNVWNSQSSIQYGRVFVHVMATGVIGIDVEMGNSSFCNGTYVVFSGVAFGQVPYASTNVGLLKRIGVEPQECAQPTCIYLCGEEVSATVLGKVVFLQTNDAPSVCVCDYGYAYLTISETNTSISSIGVFSRASFFNSTASGNRFQIDFLQDGLMCHATYAVSVGDVLGVSALSSHHMPLPILLPRALSPDSPFPPP